MTKREDEQEEKEDMRKKESKDKVNYLDMHLNRFLLKRGNNHLWINKFYYIFSIRLNIIHFNINLNTISLSLQLF